VDAVRVWQSVVNAAGGLHCHQVKYVVADDGGDPSRNQAFTQQLVEQDHVIAFVYSEDPLGGQASMNYLTQKRIPTIGDEGGDPWFYQSPMYFAQVPSGDALGESSFGGMAVAAHLQGKTKLASLTCIEAGICISLQAMAPRWAAKYGLDLVYSGRASLAQPDFTSACQAAQSAGANVFFLYFDTNSDERIARSCNSVNYHPMYASGADGVIPNIVASYPLLNGMAIGDNSVPWTDTALPSIAEMWTAYHRFAPSLQVGAASVAGWAAAKLFELAAKNIPDPPTTQSLLDGLWSVNNNDLGGLTSPLTFKREQNNPQPLCFWAMQLQGGQWNSPNASQRTCP
jgi:branched-chain amino acid transport system substrate-binding protein